MCWGDISLDRHLNRVIGDRQAQVGVEVEVEANGKE